MCTRLLTAIHWLFWWNRLSQRKTSYCSREVTPVINPPRHIPVSLKMKLNEELDWIITPTEEPTGWVSSLVIVEKPNEQWWICLDPQHLNQAVKCPLTKKQAEI